MRELRHLGFYTRELKKVLPRRYFEPVPHRLLWMIPHLAIVIGGIYAVATLPLSWPSRLGVAFLIGMSYACLGFLAHEILHGSVIRHPFLRDLLGGICFLPFCLGPKLWRKWHNVEHHGHTQHDHDDPDAMGTLEDFRERPELQWLFRLAPVMRSALTFGAFTFWFSMHSFMMWRRFLKDFQGRERLVVALQFLVPLAGWLALGAWLGMEAWVYAYVLPLLVANFTVMSYIATNHLLNPLTHVNDPLANSLTVIVPRWLDVLHFNFSHHTEHHVFPAMNPKYAPALKAALKERWPESYCEMPHWQALLALWRTPRLYRDAGAHAHQLVDPVREWVYPTAGRGLDPLNVKPQKVSGLMELARPVPPSPAGVEGTATAPAAEDLPGA